ncbi:ferredoxin-NADP reductase precursor [Panicum miliaceum]|uniref:Ferredoxin-NADP reductase n=1 Tax=Panicum miliaceum TaxID=4540 RepID=A0A3L6SE72_PANMI|nr:ferredoxin-NADP reductase precursor [Panicum miliaceum]
MAAATASKVAVSAPVFGSDRGVGSSGIKGNNNVSFSNKSWVGGTLAWERQCGPGTRTRYRDNFDGRTGSLCVRRAVYYDPETGKEDPSKNGACSNFLCNAKPGDKIQLTSPSGKIMLLPEEDPNATHIMVATGTGVAPFRGYLRRMFMEDVPNYRFGGLAWLFLGDTLKKVAEQRGEIWEQKLSQLKKNKQWHVEVY